MATGDKNDPSVMEPLVELRPEAEPPLPAAHDLLRTRTPPLGATRKDPTPMKPPQDPPRAVVVTETPMTAAPGPIVDPSAWFEESKVREPEPARPLPPAPDVAAPRMRVPTPIGVLMTPTPQRLPGPEAAAAAEDAARRAADRVVERDRADERAPLTDTGRVAALNELATDRPTIRAIRTGRTAIAGSSSSPVLDEPVVPPRPEPTGLTGGVPALVERSPLRRAAIAVLVCLAVGAAVGWLISTPAPNDDLRTIPGKR